MQRRGQISIIKLAILIIGVHNNCGWVIDSATKKSPPHSAAPIIRHYSVSDNFIAYFSTINEMRKGDFCRQNYYKPSLVHRGLVKF